MRWFIIILLSVATQLAADTDNCVNLFQSIFNFDWLRTTLGAGARQQIDSPPNRNHALCSVCILAINALKAERRLGFGVNFLSGQASFLCSLLRNEYFPVEVCRGINNAMMPIIAHVLDSRRDLTATGFCGFALQDMNCWTDDKYFEFSVKIDRSKARPIVRSKPASPLSTEKPLKIIHITDIHYDPNYREGTQAYCGSQICCRAKKGTSGFWGDYGVCDMPLKSIANAFDDINERHPDLDMIYFTGDIVDHGLHVTSVSYNRNSYATVHQLMVEKFPNTKIYWTLGNHESHPLNEFAPDYVTEPELTTNWLYEMAAEKLSTWLPNSTQATIKKDGYYTVLIRDGLRLIVLNSNVGNTYNYWVLFDPQYLGKQLQWFHDTLLEAESNGEKVHVLTHIPSGESDAFKVWVREYRAVLDRFWDTIVAQFVGHSHFNTFNVYYSRENPDLAIGQVWNGGSVSTYEDLNSNYNVYSVDAESFEVLDAYSYYYNLTAANQNPARGPEWKQLFSMRDDYHLKDLSPASLDRLMTAMALDSDLIELQWRQSVKLGDPELAKGCDKACLQQQLCELVNNEKFDKRKCKSLLEIFK